MSSMYVVFGLQRFDRIPMFMEVFVELRQDRMAGRFLSTALIYLSLHAHRLVESCTSSDGVNPSYFCTSRNLSWFTREVLKVVYRFSNSSKNLEAAGTALHV